MRNILKAVQAKVSASPKPPTTKLATRLRTLGATQDNEFNALRCTTAADNLDLAAVVLGARGARVKTLGAYFKALRVYAEIAGEPYAE